MKTITQKFDRRTKLGKAMERLDNIMRSEHHKYRRPSFCNDYDGECTGCPVVGSGYSLFGYYICANANNKESWSSLEDIPPEIYDDLAEEWPLRFVFEAVIIKKMMEVKDNEKRRRNSIKAK